MKNKHIWALGLVIAFCLPSVASANPSSFAIGASTSAATTSPAYMTAGASTSTSHVHDAYAQTFAGGVTYKTDFIGLLIQATASSTNTIYTLAAEYSQDGIDWYRNYIVDPIQAGTTTPLGIGSPFATTWKFASSSVQGAPVAANSNRSTAAILIPTPFRYTRIVASVAGGNGAVWMQLVPIKQQK